MGKKRHGRAHSALLPADTPPQSPIDIGSAKAKAKYLKRKPKFRIRASHLPSAQCVTSERVTSRRHTATQASVTRVKILENIDEYYERMRMTCSSSSPSTSTSGTSGTSSSSCSSGMKRSCEDSRSTDSVCMIDSPLAIKQEEEEEISQKLKMTKVDDRSTRLVSRCSRGMDSLAREIKLVETLANIRGDIQARQDLALKSARVHRSEGINMLVVLMAMKWKCTALKQTLDPRSMTHLARLKTRIYLDNKVHAAMHRSTSRLNLVC